MLKCLISFTNLTVLALVLAILARLSATTLAIADNWKANNAASLFSIIDKQANMFNVE